MITWLAIAVSLAVGFGLGRVHHFENLKISNIKYSIQNARIDTLADAKELIASIKSKL